MISERDLRARVSEWSLRDDVVEKDFVLGWILAGIGSEPALRDGWVFKGGTCLKKCYLETFRFSEDLDFTVIDGGPIDDGEVRSHLGKMLDRIGMESGVDFSVREPRLRVRPNGSVEGRIYYRGPRNAPMPASVRLDLTVGEPVVAPPALRPIQHLYPDQLVQPATVRCYSLEELYAEKIRAMGERGRPRDLYDIIFLLDHPVLLNRHQFVLEILLQKCTSKGVPVPTLANLTSPDQLVELESEWSNMLAHQLPALPPVEHYWERLPELFSWLEGRLTVEPLAPISTVAGERPWSPSQQTWSWGSGPPLEPVRFAGANRLCIDLGYKGSVRRVEPYSLRLTRDGNLLLYAVRQEDRELRSYRVDQIQSIEITTQPFSPVHAVEFRPTGNIAVAPTTHRQRVGTVKKPFRVTCATCGKTFGRSRPGTRINPHKSPNGKTCTGRVGYPV